MLHGCFGGFNERKIREKKRKAVALIPFNPLFFVVSFCYLQLAAGEKDAELAAAQQIIAELRHGLEGSGVEREVELMRELEQRDHEVGKPENKIKIVAQTEIVFF